jgi:hypothetical protein
MLCHVCAVVIPATNINLDRMIAKCDACNAVFNFTKTELAAAPVAVATAPVPRSEKIELVDTFDRREISFRWFNIGYIFLVFFCVIWNSFLVSWYSLALESKNAPLIMFIFPILHVAVGVGLAYATLAGFLNRTWIRLQDERLIIEHGPLPWRGNKSLPAATIEQIYADRVVSRNRNGGTSQVHRLHALLKGGQRIQLLWGRLQHDDLLFIEQQLERWLRIKDRPVAGETPK